MCALVSTYCYLKVTCVAFIKHIFLTAASILCLGAMRKMVQRCSLLFTSLNQTFSHVVLLSHISYHVTIMAYEQR